MEERGRSAHLVGHAVSVPAKEAFFQAVAAERLRNGRRLSLLRLIGVSAFFALFLLLGVLLGMRSWRGNLSYFGVYFAFALVIYLLARRYEAAGRLASLAIPLLDMPLVFLLQWTSFAVSPSPAGVAGFTVGLFVFFVILSSLSLERWQIVLTACTGALLEVILQRLAGVDPGAMAASVLLLALTAVTCIYARSRVVALVLDVSIAQLRKERLSRYFSPQVAALVDSLGESTSTGESREVTILFSDLRDFTALSERLRSEEVVAMLNEFHERMVETILTWDGTHDKYLGDGIMAYFGAPVAHADHALRAIRCALEMQVELTTLNIARERRGEPVLRMGIGIHTGRVVVGDIGAKRRREYTAIGDAVNVASRIEGLTKVHGATILVSDVTRNLAGDALRFTPAPPIAVKGKSEPVLTFVPQPEAS